MGINVPFQYGFSVEGSRKPIEVQLGVGYPRQHLVHHVFDVTRASRGLNHLFGPLFMMLP